MIVKYSELDLKFIRRAELLSREYHKNQTRKDGEPFINHPARVVFRLMCDYTRYFNAEEIKILIVLGWLHDIIEDTDITLEEIELLFGEEISNRLDALTRRDSEDYYQYGDRLIANGDKIVYLVKYADLRDNLSKIGDGAFSFEVETKLNNRWNWLRLQLHSRIGMHIKYE